MKMSRLSCAAFAVLSVTLAQADTPTEPAGSAPVPAIEEEGWALRADGDSSILPQARAIFAALNRRAGRPGPSVTATSPQTINVADLDSERKEIPDGNGSEGCKYMPVPGSRIKEMRCYYPSEGEKQLNAYQNESDLRYARDLRNILEMQELERQAYIERMRGMMD